MLVQAAASSVEAESDISDHSLKGLRNYRSRAQWSSNTSMTSADVAAEVACLYYLRQRILGLRVSNINDLNAKQQGGRKKLPPCICWVCISRHTVSCQQGS